MMIAPGSAESSRRDPLDLQNRPASAAAAAMAMAMIACEDDDQDRRRRRHDRMKINPHIVHAFFFDST
jgi:hypothetical protein